MPTAYRTVPEVGDRILNNVPPRVCPDGNGVKSKCDKSPKHQLVFGDQGGHSSPPRCNGWLYRIALTQSKASCTSSTVGTNGPLKGFLPLSTLTIPPSVSSFPSSVIGSFLTISPSTECSDLQDSTSARQTTRPISTVGCVAYTGHVKPQCARA